MGAYGPQPGPGHLKKEGIKSEGKKGGTTSEKMKSTPLARTCLTGPVPDKSWTPGQPLAKTWTGPGFLDSHWTCLDGTRLGQFPFWLET